MQLFSELQKLAKHLEPWKGSWALCGGVVASVYRDTPRFTGDIDVAVIDLLGTAARDIGELVLKEMGYLPLVGFVPDPLGMEGQKNARISGRSKESERFVGVDFLLPIFPWLTGAVERAQNNLVDYGFASLPTVTPEDLVLSKLNAIQGETKRPQDLDDLRALAESALALDQSYIAREARGMNFDIPEWLTNIYRMR